MKRDFILNRGMTFIELIVVIGIFSIMASVVLFNFRGFSSNITLQNLANQIALQIKQAQSDAIAGKNPTIFTEPDRPSYGLYFSSSETGGANKKFVSFADTLQDGVYGGGNCLVGSGNECQSEILIQSGDKIDKVCFDEGGSWECSTDSFLNISFRRPFPDANFVFGSVVSPSISKVAIEIVSVKDQRKHIVVWSTGQIEVKTGAVE